MYAFLFVLIPLAVVVALALAHNRKRHRRHVGGADMQLRIRAARESAKEQAVRWMLRIRPR